jgi:hypothetical protein
LLNIADHPLVSFIKQIPEEALEAGENPGFDFKVPLIEVFEYAIQIVAWTRLTMLGPDPTDGFNPAEYWLKSVLPMDAFREAWQAEMILGFNVGGQSKLDALSLRLDADKDSEAYRAAHKVIWNILSESSMQKVSHGKGLSHSVQLGTMLDMPENADKDHGEGTFAELLRYGTLHFRQKRPSVNLMAISSQSEPIPKGHLEPF